MLVKIEGGRTLRGNWIVTYRNAQDRDWTASLELDFIGLQWQCKSLFEEKE